MAFEFVSVYDPNSKAKRHLPLIRSYAAQHGIRARKQNRSLMGNATGAFQFRFLAAKETDDMHDDDEEGSVVDAKAQYDPRQASPPAVDRDGSQTSLSLPHENLCSQGTIDPFVSLPVPMGKRVETLFHHYVHILGPKAAYKSLFLLDYRRREQYDPTRRVLLPLILSNEVFFHAMLAAASAHQLQLFQGQDRSDSFSSKYGSSLSFHRIQTYRSVNRMIADQTQATTDAVIGAVLYLAATELIAGNIEEAQIHLGGLSKIVNLRGGIQTLPRLLAFFLNFTDSMLSLGMLEPPVFPLYYVKIQPDRLSTPQTQLWWKKNIAISKLVLIISEECQQILWEICQLTNDFDHLSTRVSSAQDLDDIEYKCVAIQYHLLNFDYTALASYTKLPVPPTEAWEQIFQGCYRLTLLIYFATGVWRFPDVLPEATQLVKILDLLQSLLSIVEVSGSWYFTADVFIWISFHAGFLATGCQRRFFVGLIRRNAAKLGITSYAEVENILDVFLYRRSIFSRPFLDLWEER